jgi:hypothetical protein
VTDATALRDRLDRLVSLHEAAYRDAGETDWRVGLRPPLREDDLDRVENQIGRLLPQEARAMYLWHDGCMPWIAPDFSFNPLSVAARIYRPIADFGLHNLTNGGGGKIDRAALFPVLNIDTVTFSVLTTVDRREPASGLYASLFDEIVDITLVANSIRGLVEQLIAEFEAGHFEHTEHGVRWTRDVFSWFRQDMEPLGEPVTK